LDTLKRSARRKLERLLAQEFPVYTQWRAMRRAHLREHRKLAAASIASAPTARGHLAWGDHSPSRSAGQEFGEPFTSFDVHAIDPFHLIVSDESFAAPDIGHLVNNIVFDQDENTSFSDALWGLLPPRFAASQASCGVAFTAPSPGRLQVSAVLQNFYNRVTFSVHDNFGFSSADVNVFLRLFIAVVRGTRVIYLPTDVITSGLRSFGADVNARAPLLDDSVPYTVSAVTDERLNANESVLVLAGSEVHIGTLLADMQCKMNAVLWWGLKKLTVGVTE